MHKISDEHLPALFRVSDRASIGAQQTFLRIIKANLILIVGSAGITSWAVSSIELRKLLAVAGAIVLVIGLVLTLYLLQLTPDRQWFGSRAIAESVKTLSWRYMTGSEPFQKNLTDKDVDALFSEELGAILRVRASIGGELGGPDASGDQITQQMREARSLSVEDRKALYLRDRISNQRSWYGKKALTNSRSSRGWLLLTASTQLAGACAAIALVLWPNTQFNAASVLGAFTAAIMAWLQVKQHQELSHSYALAAHELGLIESKARYATSEEDFSSFVSDAEAAISREHTMWVARRDVIS